MDGENLMRRESGRTFTGDERIECIANPDYVLPNVRNGDEGWVWRKGRRSRKRCRSFVTAIDVDVWVSHCFC